jgi:hypothetical protein
MLGWYDALNGAFTMWYFKWLYVIKMLRMMLWQCIWCLADVSKNEFLAWGQPRLRESGAKLIKLIIQASEIFGKQTCPVVCA